MSDYVNCPACHGKGVIPLEEARRIEAHAKVSYDAALEAERQQERKMNRAEVARRVEVSEERLRRQLAAVTAGSPQLAPERTAELRARLAKLEAERAGEDEPA